MTDKQPPTFVGPQPDFLAAKGGLPAFDARFNDSSDIWISGPDRKPGTWLGSSAEVSEWLDAIVEATGYHLKEAAKGGEKGNPVIVNVHLNVMAMQSRLTPLKEALEERNPNAGGIERLVAAIQIAVEESQEKLQSKLLWHKGGGQAVQHIGQLLAESPLYKDAVDLVDD